MRLSPFIITRLVYIINSERCNINFNASLYIKRSNFRLQRAISTCPVLDFISDFSPPKAISERE